MLNWLIRIVMGISGVIAGWFVAQDSANFGVVQMAISLLLVIGCVLLAVFWPNIIAVFKSSTEPDDSPNR
ncbi:conserved protein of unknown function [Candidatus Filomicrobium marinum]|uniref:Uncharacterized protein n=2 Tax=Filomicrobium TaxID=119044 RepID=A0A0D6JAD7_9HYPH|nr:MULTISPECIES: hypothetical protein [Filomicrobium]MCV0368527.1 hypothetical protein [Filomicrobium sp.]CFX02114.1 conserved protein of unknown function [Candidatus Filomicrobium marinum]CPR15575.1 conserved protein of unknown function [Candidatus Filomicrobium marinum]SDO62390.1 hypothetical protein SAMN04488061_1245 [Filomicrobium insigne]